MCKPQVTTYVTFPNIFLVYLNEFCVFPDLDSKLWEYKVNLSPCPQMHMYSADNQNLVNMNAI